MDFKLSGSSFCAYFCVEDLEHFIELFVVVFFHFWVYFSLSRLCLPDI